MPTEKIRIRSSVIRGVKALRECRDAEFYDTEIVSPEFGWRNRGIVMENCSVTGEYAFFSSSDIKLRGIKFSGKYSFQYAENVVIEDSFLDTKDAFWHAKNVTVRNSVVNGEYLGWYSEGLTLENCRIKGTQPLCYCRGLRLIDCETEAADLSFEYSDVDADLKGNVVSVKNPRSGRIVADSIGEMIFSGVGGQHDFMYGCSLSEGGKCFIALPSRTNKGKSKIVPTLTPGAGVVTTRFQAQYIATEYGIVFLRGKNLAQRAKALISIAHPDDREELEKAACQRFGYSFLRLK